MSDTDQKQEDDVLRRMLNTPPTPHKPLGSRPLEYVIIDGKMFVADISRRDGHSITADLYLNPTAYRRGEVMERSVRLET